jgi:hypothetical protein
MLFDSEGVWCVTQVKNGIQIVLRSGPAPGRPYHLLELNQDLTQGHVVLDPAVIGNNEKPFILRDPMHELWISFLLMRGFGLLVHGCAVLHLGKVHVFLGQSGAGKSTLARVFNQLGVGEVLTDDRIIIRRRQDEYIAYGTPWHGEECFASPAFGKLASINFINHAPSSKLKDVSVGLAVASMFRVCFIAGWPRSGMEFVFGMCTEVCQKVPCRQLFVYPDRSAIEAAGLI